MGRTLLAVLRRWSVFGGGVVAAVLPAEWLTVVFGDPSRHSSTLLALWGEFLVGPVRYWLPVLLGHPSEYALHPMAGVSTWVYAACLPLTLAHPIRPRLVTACVTGIAFLIWYGWAWLTLVAFNVPC